MALQAPLAPSPTALSSLYGTTAPRSTQAEIAPGDLIRLTLRDGSSIRAVLVDLHPLDDEMVRMCFVTTEPTGSIRRGERILNLDQLAELRKIHNDDYPPERARQMVDLARRAKEAMPVDPDLG